ncbi:MAG: AEC family transporter [Clostridia bacterium]
MGDIVSTAVSFILLIFISYFLKTKGVFTNEAKKFLSSVIINLCLPCVILNGFRDFDYDNSLILAIFICIFISIVSLILGYLISRKRNRDSKILHMMNGCGYNIGIFTIPFVSNFLSSTAVVCALMFDIGNAIFVFGALSAATSFVVDNNRSNPIPVICKKLFTNIPFVVYMILLLLLALNITPPSFIYPFVELCSGATSFLAMIMIGLMIEFKINFSEIKEIASTLIFRYSISLVSAILIFQLPMFEHELKKALIIAVFSPMSTACVVYTEKLKCKPSLIGAVSSLSIVISIVAIISIIIFI